MHTFINAYANTYVHIHANIQGDPISLLDQLIIFCRANHFFNSVPGGVSTDSNPLKLTPLYLCISR